MVIGNGPILLALVVVKHGAVRVGVAIAGVELDCRCVVGDRVFDLPCFLPGNAAIVIGDRVLGIDGDGGGAIGDGEIGLSLILVNDAAGGDESNLKQVDSAMFA